MLTRGLAADWFVRSLVRCCAQATAQTSTSAPRGRSIWPAISGSTRLSRPSTSTVRAPHLPSRALLLVRLLRRSRLAAATAAAAAVSRRAVGGDADGERRRVLTRGLAADWFVRSLVRRCAQTTTSTTRGRSIWPALAAKALILGGDAAIMCHGPAAVCAVPARACVYTTGCYCSFSCLSLLSSWY